MSKIEIVKNEYNTICDTYGCNNIGAHMIGKPGENLAFHKIMCDECLQEIINAAPLEMIMNRPGMIASELKDGYLKNNQLETQPQSIRKEFIPEDSNGPCTDSTPCTYGQYLEENSNKEPYQIAQDIVGKALEGEENETDLHELKYQQLKEIAAERGIKVPFGTSRDDLIDMLTGK